ncbi:YcaO-like family protein [Patescibacteria group bacterium]|nr:YcaO-like family protein [Patescibacteria group bacterium]
MKGKHRPLYYTIPLRRKETLFYTYPKKYLVNTSKRKIDRAISDFLSEKECDERYIPIFETLKLLERQYGSEVEFSSKKTGKARMIEKLCELKDWTVFLGQNVGIDDNVKKILEKHWGITCLKYGKCETRDNSSKLIIGLIYDESTVDFLIENKNLLLGNFCCLIGIEQLYILEISRNSCIKCIRLRSMVNQKNLFETLLLEDYFKRTNTEYFLDGEEISILIDSISQIKDSRRKDVIIRNKSKQKTFVCYHIFPFPLCPTCEGRSLDNNIPMKLAVDQNVGIIKKIEAKEVEIGEEKFYISTVQIPNLIPVSRMCCSGQVPVDKIHDIVLSKNQEFYDDFSIWRRLVCGSVARHKKISRKKAVGESVERYCASLYLKKQLKFGSYKKLKFGAINPENWIMFSQKQYRNHSFPYECFSEDSELFWKNGFMLKTKEKVYLPASFIYIRYSFDQGESGIGVYPTTGLACGNKKRDILLSGICENIERDACVLMWLYKISPRRVINIKDQAINSILSGFKKIGIDVFLFEVSLDINIPTVLAIGLNKKEDGPKMFIGSASKPIIKKAILRALEELTQGFTWSYLMDRHSNFDFGKNFKNITHFEHHALFNSTARDMSSMNFILNTKRVLNYEDLKQRALSFKEIVDEIDGLGYKSVVVDLTTPDVASMELRVFKTLITGLQPLNANHNTPFLDNRRIRRVKRYLKMNNIRHSEKVNSYPHPFT